MSDEAQAISSAISGAVSGVLVPWLNRRDASPRRSRSTSETRAGGGRLQPPVDSDSEDVDTRRAAKR